MLRADDTIGPYTLVSKLGRGAFGVVWLAEKRSSLLTTRVALKLPNDEDIDLHAVRREASVWAQAAGHPNVQPIIDADVYGDQVVIVSEYAPGGTLSAWMQRHGGKAPSADAAVRMIAGVLAGLEHLHSKNIIHRDLKPDNILLQGETPRLADFGIARVLKTTSPYSTMVSGTPQYMAPEAYKGRRSEQTDLWSVGVILYQLLAGSSPFPQDDAASVMFAVLTEQPAPLPPATPRLLREVVAKSLEKESARRYRSAKEMREAVQRLSHSLAVPSNSGSRDETEIPTIRDAPETTAPTRQDDSVSPSPTGSAAFDDEETVLGVERLRKTDKGYIDVKDDVAFRTSAEAASCFGKTYKGLQRGGVKHPNEAGKIIWFPKLYDTGEWNNRMSDDKTIIWEINESPEKAKEHIDHGLNSEIQSRIVFAHVKDSSGKFMYHFMGEYRLDRQATNYQDGLVWRRVAERVKTYPPRGSEAKFADGTWPEGMKDEIKMCLEHMDVTRSVYARVSAEGSIKKSELKNQRERQIALRLATLGYFKYDTLSKNVKDRTFWLAPEKPKLNPLSL